MEKNLEQQPTNIIKIALFGPESTGKTTLCQQLATHFETVWTPEYAREYLQQKWNNDKTICQPEDLLPIAIGQIALENGMLTKANQILFCDTTLLLTKVFSELHYNFCESKIDIAAKNHHYDLFFLTDIDVLWQQDDLRDKPTDRQQTFKYFKDTLIHNNKPFFTLTGNENVRLQTAITIINEILILNNIGLNAKDLLQIKPLNIPIENISKQLEIFENGVPKINLVRPAIINDGILEISETRFNEFVTFFDQNKNNFDLQKFVPASGAASRMFQFLSQFINDFDIETESINGYINKKNAKDLAVFLVGLEKLPFYDLVNEQLILDKQYTTWTKDQRIYEFIKLMLLPTEFNFANQPKGVLPFHLYQNQIITATEEHLKETILYANSNQISKLHLTVSEEHKAEFMSIINTKKQDLEEKFGSKIEVSYSCQHQSTNTIAVDLSNNPLRDSEQKLVFRPGGHGALIENLNDLTSDIIFIKNIDNVILKETEKISFYKKALAGILITIQNKIFNYLKELKNNPSESLFEDICTFLNHQLKIEIPYNFDKYTFENKIKILQNAINKPIRVCGMVKNESEPGGGPFWVMDKNGKISLQIVEASQIDLDNKKQLGILQAATHFNPVDIVCGIKNYNNQKFDLKEFVNNETGFIVQKNKNGIDLKGYELPGLWNGAMASWITIFVAVPILTFNPVKTVNDLLKPAHQN